MGEPAGGSIGLMRGYGQFCPVAKAAEIVGERWTPLVLRELVCGSRRFNELRRGVPLMSPALLSKRLKTLEEAGIVERRPVGGIAEYRLTRAGEELRPLVEMLGVWGQRWVRSRLGPEDLDVSLLMWDMQRSVKPQAFPAGRTVVRFAFADAPKAKRLWWLLSDGDAVDLCPVDPGFDVDLYVATDVRTMTMVWMGERTLDDALGADAIELIGPTALRRRLRSWLGLSAFAGVADGSRDRAEHRTEAHSSNP